MLWDNPHLTSQCDWCVAGVKYQHRCRLLLISHSAAANISWVTRQQCGMLISTQDGIQPHMKHCNAQATPNQVKRESLSVNLIKLQITVKPIVSGKPNCRNRGFSAALCLQTRLCLGPVFQVVTPLFTVSCQLPFLSARGRPYFSTASGNTHSSARQQTPTFRKSLQYICISLT